MFLREHEMLVLYDSAQTNFAALLYEAINDVSFIGI
jgi:hypothetical protein